MGIGHAVASSWLRPLVGAGFALFAGLSGCKCGKEDPSFDQLDVPTSEGSASQTEAATGVGTARGLDTSLGIATSTEWGRIIGQNADLALLGGRTQTDAVALFTDNGGRRWRALRTPVNAEDVVTWSLGADGTAVVAVGRREKPKRALPAGQKPPLESLGVHFAAPGDDLSGRAPLIDPPESTGTRIGVPTIPLGDAIPAVLDKDLASFVVETGPRRFALGYAVPPGTEALPPPTPLPAGEQPVFAPYGRPPVLLTTGPRGVLRRPWPKPGEPLDPPESITLPNAATIARELSLGPECEAGPWSYRRLTLPGNRVVVLGISAERSAVVDIPSSTIATSPLGCGETRVVVEAVNPTDGKPSLVGCTIDGDCTAPDNRPFRTWTEDHERNLLITSVSRGIITFYGAITPRRWGLFTSYSLDGGKLFELQRDVGEGQGDRGRFEPSALWPMGDRALLLMSADVTGTSRRAWFLLASPDGGTTWGPP